MTDTVTSPYRNKIPYFEHIRYCPERNPHEAFWDAVAYIHGHLPRLADEGMAGYFVVIPTNGSMIFSWSFHIYERPPNTAATLFSPIESHIKATYPSLHLSATEKQYATWLEAYKPNIYPEPVGHNSLIASRLLPRASLENNFESIRSMLATAVPKVGQRGIVGQLIAAGQVSRNRHLSTAVHPAWRSAYLNLVITVTWPDGTPLSTVLEIRRFNSEISVEALEKLALAGDSGDGVGAYVNEADAYTKREDAGRVFWGTKYDELKTLKERWDPEGVFWCRLCIGNEGWVEEGSGRLCLA
ncbi:hypothetical protein C7212DRAFT_359414 [Tuber magnatum]|uniref:Berberine/berberine-like domain-containing protein n=1 Tax=Tuber magnatum TaxID=42249 RepID=A0A317SGH5_9PEZI|nr:hypothetical protein C7212DRAFT_359414 [Tuber magnatum]